jgi:FkbM family methyltransferase
MNTHIDPIFLGEVYTTYRQCLELMGINCTLGCDAPEELQHIKSGEQFFAEVNLKHLIKDAPIIFDVGANEGRYAEMISSVFPRASLYCFEPHPKNFERLKQRGVDATFLELALGEEKKSCALFERVDYPEGSEMASVYETVITELHGVESVKIDVKMQTIDNLVRENNLPQIDFLKIDVEGHELGVLQGARQTIAAGKLKVVQYEFNHPNIESKVFMRDFRKELKDYQFFRLVEQGVLPLLDHPIFQEIFGYQNIVAVHDSLSLKVPYARTSRETHFIPQHLAG